MTDPLLDAHEVADWLGVPVSWVRESTRSGAMPCVQLGRYRRYDRARASVVGELQAAWAPDRVAGNVTCNRSLQVPEKWRTEGQQVRPETSWAQFSPS